MALSSIIWIDRCEGNALTLWYPTFSFGKTWPWAPAYTAVTELKWDKTCPSDWVIWDAQVFCGIATLPGHETDSFISYTVSSHRVVCKQIGRQAPSSISVGELRLRCLKLRNSTQGALHPMPTFIGKPENKPSSWKRELHRFRCCDSKGYFAAPLEPHKELSPSQGSHNLILRLGRSASNLLTTHAACSDGDTLKVHTFKGAVVVEKRWLRRCVYCYLATQSFNLTSDLLI